MNIVINAISIRDSQGGVKTFICNLINGLVNIDENYDIIVICSKVSKKIFESRVKKNGSIELFDLPVSPDGKIHRILWDQVAVPFISKRFEDAVLLSQASVSSVACPLPEVVIVQAPLSVQSVRKDVPSEIDTTSLLQKIYYDTMLPATLCRANEVVAVSDHLRRKIAGLYPQYADKVRTVHEGVQLDNFTPESGQEVSSPFQNSYLLFASWLYPYKRADQAVRAFGRAMGQCGRNGLRLKLAGKDPGGQIRRLKRIARETGVSDQVDILGAVPHEKMPKLYRGAKALLFPSTVETFGLPVLEAMACGTPVIASDRMSVPEVVGNAGLTVDPDNVEEMADAMCHLLENKSLQEDLRRKGKERVKKFTWDRTARGIRDALQDAMESEEA
ncbi:glycosyltransferase involved in cell wall biosynthesis [Salinibacter ruber]|uniref:glycosyltransferase family 4 protein n=1 Tax=Salinibacter ruber TaxID=146919 RepID=UPI000E58A892|nr:glycosyltransferase family 1 protein [Salinibacter ruber]MCS3705891.1 glycosyltransferase involved in cell wall biosynthesis [Salinibacter ruber]